MNSYGDITTENKHVKYKSKIDNQNHCLPRHYPSLLLLVLGEALTEQKKKKNRRKTVKDIDVHDTFGFSDEGGGNTTSAALMSGAIGFTSGTSSRGLGSSWGRSSV